MGFFGKKPQTLLIPISYYMKHNYCIISLFVEVVLHVGQVPMLVVNIANIFSKFSAILFQLLGR